MKIRIVSNTIRVRLTQSEIEALKNDGEVLERTNFVSEPFIYSVGLSDDVDEPEASFRSGHISILLPESDALDWIGSDQTGIENREYTEQGEGIKLLIEKDFQCLHVRRNEDESDAFPNPLAHQ